MSIQTNAEITNCSQVPTYQTIADLGIYGNLHSTKYIGAEHSKQIREQHLMTSYANAFSVLPPHDQGDDTDSDISVESEIENDRVAASYVAPVEGFPTETELAMCVRSLPKQVNGHLLAERSCMLPKTESGQVTKLFLKHGSRGRASIVDAGGKHYAGGVVLKDHRHGIIRRHSTKILYDESGKPVVLCAEQKGTLNKTYNIYGTQPLVIDDTPQETKSGINFHAWFQVHENDLYHLAHRSVLVWNGVDYEPMWRAYPATRRQQGSTKSFLIQSTFTGENMGFVTKRSDVTVAPGVDPALMLCLASIL